MAGKRITKYPYYLNGKTIFLGNGLTRALINDVSWNSLFPNVSESIPFSLRHRMIDNFSLEEVLEKIGKDTKPTPKFQEVIISLIEAGFSNFITTNYTYEIEYSLVPERDRNEKFIIKNTYSMSNDRLDPQISISNYIRIPFRGKIINVWHIHGEQRKKYSLILNHDSYSTLIGKIANYDVSPIFKLHERGYGFSSHALKSWVELFFLADIHIIGYGLDYSEFDIWWLLEKRKKFNVGSNSIYFYLDDPYKFDKDKKELLIKEDIELISLKEVEDIHKNFSSDSKYEKAFEMILNYLINKSTKKRRIL